MSLTVEKIMNLLPSSYRIRLVAGKGGLCRSDINWVSLVEDYDTEKFRNINQIVITAGINMKCEEELAEYVKNLHEARTAALILNVGKYIKKVDDEIINFCNKVDLPLYTMPWDVLMSDLVRDISKILILNEKNKKSIFELIQSIVFNTGNINKHINELCMYGFSEEMYYCPIIIKSQHDGIETIPDMALKSLKTVFENSISKIRDAKMIMFTYNRKIAVVVAYYNKGDVEKYVDDISKNIGAGGFFNHRITLFVGKQNDMLNRLSVNFKRLNQFLNFSSKKDFDEIGRAHV